MAKLFKALVTRDDLHSHRLLKPLIYYYLNVTAIIHKWPCCYAVATPKIWSIKARADFAEHYTTMNLLAFLKIVLGVREQPIT